MRFRTGLGDHATGARDTHTAQVQHPGPGEPGTSVAEPEVGAEGVALAEGEGEGELESGQVESGVTREVSVGLDEGLSWDQGEATGVWQLEDDEEPYDPEGNYEDEQFQGEELEGDGFEGEGYAEEGDEEGFEEPLEDGGLGGPYADVYWSGLGGETSPGPGPAYGYEGAGYGPVQPYEPHAATADQLDRVRPRTKRSSGQHKRKEGQRSNGPWPELVTITAVAIVAAAAVLALTSTGRLNLTSNRSPGSANAGSTTLLTSGLGAKTVATDKEVTAKGTPAKTKAKASSPSARVKNLPVPPSIERQLIDAWVATDPAGLKLTTQDVGGTVPGETYYAYDVSISTYFAIVAFQPSPVLSKDRTATAQDDLQAFQGSEYVFSLQTGSVWTWLGVGTTGNCPGEWVPPAVLAAWRMCGLKPPTA